jgi:hypothetical protein
MICTDVEVDTTGQLLLSYCPSLEPTLVAWNADENASVFPDSNLLSVQA